MATAVEFDFATRQERTIPVEAAPSACAGGKFCWIDLDVIADRPGAAGVLRRLGLDPRVIAEALGPGDEGRHDVYHDCLHLAIAAAEVRDGRLATNPVDALLGERFLVTIRRGEAEFLARMRATYPEDFRRHAQSPGFLLYEFWDHLTNGYRRSARSLTERVRRLQDDLFGNVDDAIFARVAVVLRELLGLRAAILSARDILCELSTRRSELVAETTRPYLTILVGTLERLAGDLSVEREVLSETLNLYMGIVGHRTNRVVNRLTVLSTIFLPLTFLCGVYGMNFEHLPELRWRHGYLAFWAVSILIAAASLVFMKRRGWL